MFVDVSEETKLILNKKPLTVIFESITLAIVEELVTCYH